MLGSSQSIADSNVALNTIMAEELAQFANELEKADDFDAALQELVCRTLTQHQRIIFNGNGYSDEWKKEAEKRGLSNHNTTAKCLSTYISQKNIDLVTKHGIFNEAEFLARHEIHLESYCKNVNIEALTSIDMVLHQILPAVMAYSKELCNGILAKQQAGISCNAEKALAARLSTASDRLYENCEKLRADLQNVPAAAHEAVTYYQDVIIAGMQTIREDADLLEQLTDKKYWPYPTYSDLLFY